MKFNYAALDAPIEADWPVTVRVPMDGGETQEQRFTARFRFVPEEALLACGETVKGAKEALRMVFVGLGKDEGVPFTDELRDRMIDPPWVRLALNATYRQFVMGIEVKNSETPPA